MLRIIVHGCLGKMGTVLTDMIKKSDFAKMTAGVDALCQEGYSLSNPSVVPLFNTFDHCREEADVVIDFSNPVCLPALLDFTLSKNLPLVIATTGYSDEEEQKIKEASRKIPLFRSANMSIGINVMASLVGQTAAKLEEEFHVEIIEKHHKNKVDSPSGTAFLLADAVNQGCQSKKNLLFGRHGRSDTCNITDLGIHAVRGGSIPGDHTVLFAGAGETLEITHRAMTRDIFAGGSLKAALFLVKQKPGYYSMEDLLTE